MPLTVITIHHVGIVVTDIGIAKAFYGGVLGLRELPRPAFDFEGAWYDLGDRQLHLIVHPPARTLRGTPDIDARDGHVALRVADFEETLAHLQAHGVPIHVSRENVTPWMQIYVTDPDGNVIELNVDRERVSIGAAATRKDDDGR